MAGKAGSGNSRKRNTGKRRIARKRPRILLLAALTALVAGFLVRRTMLPPAMHYLTHRAPDRQPVAIDVNRDSPSNVMKGDPRAASTAKARVPSEHLSSRDRHDLDSLIDQKVK